MKIVHVIDSLEVGGAEAVVVALAALQTAAGHDVEVHCLEKSGPLGDALHMNGVRVYVHGPAASLKLTWRLYSAFHRSKPDVVHCHNKSATVHAAAAARVSGARAVIATRHGMAAPPYRLRKELKFWLTAAMFCDQVVAVCDTARRNMMAGARALARKVVTVRNGAFPKTGADGDGVVKDGFTLISVGRLAPAKNYGMLLRSVALARQRVPDLALWLVGDGDEAPALRRLTEELGISGVVRFCGERPDVGSWLRKADVFVLSSLSEGLPISVLEAMAAGLPTIVTDVGGMPEIVKLSGAGAVVPAGNPERLAAAIVDFALRRNELPGLGHRARSCYEQHFTPERMADEYLTLYRRGHRESQAIA